MRVDKKNQRKHAGPPLPINNALIIKLHVPVKGG